MYPHDRYIKLAVTREMLASYEAEAAAAQLNLSAWMRSRLNGLLDRNERAAAKGIADAEVRRKKPEQPMLEASAKEIAEAQEIWAIAKSTEAGHFPPDVDKRVQAFVNQALRARGRPWLKPEEYARWRALIDELGVQ